MRQAASPSPEQGSPGNREEKQRLRHWRTHYFLIVKMITYLCKKLSLFYWPTNELAYLSSTKFIFILHFPNVLGNKLSQVKCFLNLLKLRLIFTMQRKFL